MKEGITVQPLPPSRLFTILTSLGTVILLITIIHFAMLWQSAHKAKNEFKSLEGKLYAYLSKKEIMLQINKTKINAEEYPNDTIDAPSLIARNTLIRLSYSPESIPELTKIESDGEEIRDWDVLYKRIIKLAPSLVTSNGDAIPIVIDADDRVTLQAVVNALNICKKAGVAKCELAFPRKDNVFVPAASQNNKSRTLPKLNLEKDSIFVSNLRKALKAKGGVTGQILGVLALILLITSGIAVFKIKEFKFSVMGFIKDSGNFQNDFDLANNSVTREILKEQKNLNIFPLLGLLTVLISFLGMLFTFFPLLSERYGYGFSMFAGTDESILTSAYVMLVFVLETAFMALFCNVIYLYFNNKLNSILIQTRETLTQNSKTASLQH